MTLRILLFLLMTGIAATVAAQEVTKHSSENYLIGEDGVRLFYRRVGRGKKFLVYVHGGPGSNFRGQEDYIEPLVGDHTVIMYDQRGSGRSEVVKDPTSLTVDHHVKDLEAVRKHFQAKRISIVALSWGSGLAALYASQYPEHVDRIVFVGPISPTRRLFDARLTSLNSLRSGEEIARRRELQGKLLSADDTETVKICRELSDSTFRLYFAEVTPAKLAHAARRCDIPSEAIRNRPVVEAAVLSSLGGWDLRPALRKVRIPALVVEGERTNVPLDATREFTAALPNSRLLLIPKAGHESFVDQPDRFLDAVRSFLGGKFPHRSERVIKTK